MRLVWYGPPQGRNQVAGPSEGAQDMMDETTDPARTPPEAATEAVAGGEADAEARKRLARRRRLLKGVAAGIPAIITLKSGSLLAATSISCVKQDAISTLANYGNARCVASQTAGNANGLAMLANNDPAWSGTGPDTGVTGKWCAVYMAEDGTLPAGPNWGATAPGTGNIPPAANYYAVTDSCWSSFH